MAKVKVVLNRGGMDALLKFPKVAGYLEGRLRSAVAGDARVTVMTGRTRANVRAESAERNPRDRRAALLGALGRV